MGTEHIALNSGAAFRVLHDSLVNYGGNRPEHLLTTHEEVAVALAHGYAKAKGGRWPPSCTTSSALSGKRWSASAIS